ncbi:MAG: hypothetical protein ACD_7C00143G0007 [uncultured bacterium]|nr:MAG: hypothetical protein ACD_7C00143G0007 [uncultured bacterium]KKP67264.1 MAG: hypothetical protein UR66_C0018G0004 [Candidatus Moranbacteria bacterium GW2011_GWE1_35_17]KKP81195.1 MAG: hypothetical protein UR82_C0070G0008 [Candidatus Moranbacteria bacterium GW2011_GWF1_35_5]KKP83533.1 MAG: hypothetical protein UR83_C0035G0010 [Candidatus Moranbacteria bacterium GW2011_GWF2_35_54]HBR79822.1 hypothetical protein [Candidatus Moranbacteria bacterium]
MKKNIKKSTEQMYKPSEMMVMLESINDNVALIAEQHGGIISRLDGIDNRLDGIDNRLDGIDNRLDSIDDILGTMQIDISDIKYDLKQKVSYEEFEKMEKRVIKLEKLVFMKLSN